jgi:CHAD domain-containing protein
MAKPTRVLGLDRNTALTEAGPKLLAVRFGEVVRLTEWLSRHIEPTGLHEVRVAVRRFRVALALFPGAPLDDLSRRARRLHHALGVVRDLEVQIEWLASVAPTNAVAKALLAEKRGQVALQEKSLAGALSWWRRGRPPVAFQQVLSKVHGKLGGKQMRSALRKRLDQVDRWMEALQDSVDSKRGHRARIAVKKLRYLTELLEPAFPDVSSRLLDALVKSQEHLGELHDASVWAVRSCQQGNGRRGRSSRDTSLLALLAAERMKLAQARVRKDVRRWHHSGVAARVRSLLSS